MPATIHTLTIRFSPLDDQTYRIQIASPTSGDCASTFTPPYNAGTWSAILEALAPNFDFATASPATQAALKPLGNVANLPRTAGTTLTQALLASSEIAAGLEIALSIASAERQPLAVEMRFAQGCDAVADLPWELLYYRDRFLLADTSIALSRYPEDAIPPTPVLAELPLRVLLVLPGPLDTAPVLSHEARAELLHGLRTLDEAGAVIVDLLRPPTFATLVEAVTNGGYQVLVFYGHGAHDPAAGGQLLFEDEFGGRTAVLAGELAAAVRNTPVRLVLLGACESAAVRGDDEHNVNVWRGTASALIRAGVPLAIGMQTAMRVDAALAFIRQFALSLAAGKPVIDAVADARRPLVVGQYGGAWFIPTLYGRPAPDYRLFDPAQPLPAATAELQAAMQEQRAEIKRLEEAVRRVGVLGQAEEIAGLRQAQADFARTRAELARRTPGGYAVVTSPLYGVPSNPIFVGRSSEVRECGRKLKDTHPVMIWGAGGIGKTALAAEVAHRQGWRFPAGVLWLDCRGGPALDTLLDRIGAFAGVAAIAQVKPDKKVSTARFALADLEDRCLLVWDNAEDVWGERSVREFVQQLPANCQVLLTTRENPEVPMWQVLELPPLPDQAMELLFDRLAANAGVKVGTWEDLDIIPPMLDWLQGHPLAVTLVVPLVAKRGLRRVWEDLRRQPLKGVAAAFEVSYGRLTALQKRVFTRASVYAIPVQWEAIEALLPGKSKVDDALDVLVQQALVGFNGSSYTYHALLRQYAYAKLRTNKDIQLVHRLAAGYLQSLAKERARTSEEVLEEVDQWEQAAAWEEFVRRASNLVGTLDRLGFWAEIQGRLERALTAVREHLGAPAELHGQALDDLANVHLKRADWDIAEKLCQEALAVYWTVDDESRMARTYNNLGNVYLQKGEWDRAIEFYQQSLATFERLGDSHGIAHTYINLGSTYFRKGEWDRAVEFYQQSLTTKERLSDIHGMANTRMGLGNVYLQKGKWGRAIKCYQQSLTTFKRLGDIHGQAQTLVNLGSAYFRKGERDRAIEFYQQSLNAFKRLGDSHGMTQTLANLGVAYADKGEWDRAIEFYQQSLTTFKRLGDSLGMAHTFGNLGNAYADKGEWDRAIEFYQKDLAIDVCLGDSQSLAQTLGNLGLAYARKGEWDRTIEFYQQSLTTFERLGDSQGMAQTLANLGYLYWNHDKKDEAVSVVAQAYLIFAQLGLASDARQAGGTLVEWLGSVEAGNAYLVQLMQSTSQQQQG